MRKIGINFGAQGFQLTDEEVMRLLRDVGFDSFFYGWNSDDQATGRICELAAKYGLEYESVHSPFRGISHIWEEGEKGDAYVAELKRVADTCHRFGIGYMTTHAANAPRFNNNGPHGSKFSAIGEERFAEIVEYAGERGVKVAIENVEFPDREMLSLVRALEARGLEKGLATLFDVGHWHCYPADMDFAEAFGKYLIGTHVHDNFGQRDPRTVTWDDDNHLLPFDGTIDYRKAGETLKRCPYPASITLELARARFLLPWYAEYTPEQFFATAAERARNLAKLCE